jgi:GntR family transcriptional repressor for pyruvate dehydrogenase complex
MTDFVPLTRQPSLTARVSEALLEAISAGRLKPGDKLPSERELSDQFGVSRTVIRETVRGLEAKGVIEPIGARGVVVAAVPASRVAEALDLYMRGAQSQDLLGADEITEVRETLEVKLVRLASSRATDAELDAIATALSLMAQAASPEIAAHHDEEFHHRIALATHNALFVTLLESLNTTLRPIRRMSLAIPGRLRDATEEHHAVLVALRARDADAAEAAIRNHLDDSTRFYSTE